MASACGVTAFIQQQLHAGGGFVGGGRSEALKREKLPRFASGQELCGVAFSHLRRSGPPMVHRRARRRRLPRLRQSALGDGVGACWTRLSWARCACPKTTTSTFTSRKPAMKTRLQPGPRIPLVVMNASDTVEVTLTDLFLPDDYVLYERPADALRRGDFCGISGHVFLPLGCARGSVHYLRTLAEQRGNDSFAHAADELTREIDACRHEALTWSGACADQAGLQRTRPPRPRRRHCPRRPRRPRRRHRDRRQRPSAVPSPAEAPARSHLLHDRRPDARCSDGDAGFVDFAGMLVGGLLTIRNF